MTIANKRSNRQQCANNRLLSAGELHQFCIMERDQPPPALKFSIDRILQGERDDSNSSSEQSEGELSPSPPPSSPTALLATGANAQFYPYLLQLMSTMRTYPILASPTSYATDASTSCRATLCGNFSPQFFRLPVPDACGMLRAPPQPGKYTRMHVATIIMFRTFIMLFFIFLLKYLDLLYRTRGDE